MAVKISSSLKNPSGSEGGARREGFLNLLAVPEVMH